MKLKNEFVTVLNNDTFVTVSTDTKLFSGMLRGNSTAAFIMKCLEEEISFDKLIEKICDSYEADYETVKTDVEQVIEKLRLINAIDE